MLPQNIHQITKDLSPNNENFPEKYHMWCSHCDDLLIISPKGGNIYRVFGHLWNNKEKELGSYDPVYFSLCHTCDFFSKKA